MDQLEELNGTFSDQLREGKTKLLTQENESDFIFENLTNTLRTTQSQFKVTEDRVIHQLVEINITFFERFGEVKNELRTHENESDFAFKNLTSTLLATHSQFEAAKDRLIDQLEEVNITFSSQLGEVKNKYLIITYS